MTNRMLHPGRIRRGFSLIELMIVVCIIGLLATVALPQFQNILLRTKQAEREAMMPSIMRMLNEYSNAHGGQFPGGADPDLPPNPPFPPNGSKQAFSVALGHWADLGWTPDGLLQYRYDVTRTGPDTLAVTAQADLDRNGHVNIKTSTYKLQNGTWQRLSEWESPDPF
ncbi:prepilin-type N-terminal cleavage/methylation domain-containing protein [Archangium sp.]|uniref:type IV pilin protein n=1 Tax=Archangium sp. TaxID=1872627 RepID=UPI002D22E380|nr:prepilin-type N-terminal cleavage/methylation domain-containing protein [Archangium sp.]HYO52657.1 prepilin-type N-terminal cleavage/methylation domain-containing protein [Archangium sp.]